MSADEQTLLDSIARLLGDIRDTEHDEAFGDADAARARRAVLEAELKADRDALAATGSVTAAQQKAADAATALAAAAKRLDDALAAAATTVKGSTPVARHFDDIKADRDRVNAEESLGRIAPQDVAARHAALDAEEDAIYAGARRRGPAARTYSFGDFARRPNQSDIDEIGSFGGAGQQGYGMQPVAGEGKARANAAGGAYGDTLRAGTFGVEKPDGESKAEVLKKSGDIPENFGFAFKPKAGFPFAPLAPDGPPPVVYPKGVDAGTQAEISRQAAEQKARADAERVAKEAKEKGERDQAARDRGHRTYAMGSVASQVASGGLGGAASAGNMVAQLGNAGVLGAAGSAPGFGAMAGGIGAGVEAGVKLMKSGFDTFGEAMRTAGTVAKQAFGNDGLGIIQTAAGAAAKGLNAIPVVGGLAASALEALVAPVGLLQAAMGAATGRAHELAQYSATISVAESQAEMKQVFADMREANKLGDKYAEMVRKEQEVNQKFQEALQPLKEKLMEVLPALADAAAAMLPVVLKIGEGIAYMAAPFLAILDQTAKANAALKKILDENKKMNEKLEEAPDDMGAFDGVRRVMDQLQIPHPGPNPQAGQFARNNNLPFFLGINVPRDFPNQPK